MYVAASAGSLHGRSRMVGLGAPVSDLSCCICLSAVLGEVTASLLRSESGTLSL